MTQKPLITICVVAYKQEQFIRKAIEGAFSQTYSPLEIVISDDCSPDGTFNVMEEMVAKYRGPHHVFLNRNETNLGLCAHFNRVIGFSHGQFIFGSAGDDVSLPDRVDVLVRVWERDPERIMLVQSGFVVVDESDQELGVVRKAPSGREIIKVAGRERLFDYVRTLRLATSGSTFAFHRSIFEVFGPLPARLFHEDNVILLRALLLGEMWMVGVPLIHRRVHGGNLMMQKGVVKRTKAELDGAEMRTSQAAEHRAVLYDAFVGDLTTARQKGILSQSELEQLLALCQTQRERFAIERDYHGASFFEKLAYLRQLRQSGFALPALRHFVMRLIPWPILRALKQIAAPLRKPEVDSILRGGEDFGLWKD